MGITENIMANIIPEQFSIAHGKYCSVSTPSVAVIYAPAADHGIRGTKTVPESSRVLDKFLGCRFFLG